MLTLLWRERHVPGGSDTSPGPRYTLARAWGTDDEKELSIKKVLSVSLAIMLMFSLNVSAVAQTFVDDGIFVTEEMILRDKDAIAAYAREGAAIRNMAVKVRVPTQKELSVPLMLQDDPEWADIEFPCGHETFASAGCAMTSYAMMSEYINENSETPITFTDKYYGTEEKKLDPCSQTAARAAIAMETKQKAGAVGEIEVMENAMIAAINQNKPIIVRVNAWGSHYFVAYGYYITSEGSVSIYINDPEGDFGGTLLSDYYPDYSIRSFAIFG